jgi:hypothetical protein
LCSHVYSRVRATLHCCMYECTARERVSGICESRRRLLP